MPQLRLKLFKYLVGELHNMERVENSFENREVSIMVLRSLKLKFGLHFLLSKFHIVAGIWILFMLSKGFSLGQIAVFDVALFGAILLFEVPTGFVADWFGRKLSVIICYLIQAAVILSFLFARQFWQFLLIFFVWGIGITMRSGAEEAWIYDELNYLGQVSGIPSTQIRYRFQQFVGFFGTIGLFAIALGQILGGIIAENTSFRVAFFVAFTIYMSAALWLFTIPEHPLDSSKIGKTRPNPQLSDALFTLRTPPIMLVSSIIILMSMIAGSMLLFMQAYLRSVGVGIAIVGLIYGLKSAITGVGNSFSAKIISPKRETIIFPLIALLGLSYLLMAIEAKEIVIVAYFAVSAIYGLLLPFFFSHINQHIEANIRATTISLISLIGSIFVFSYELSFARIIDFSGFKWYFYTNTILVWFFVLPLAFKWRYHNIKGHKQDEESELSTSEKKLDVSLIAT